MTKFSRSGHYRTNANGTTFWVSGHDVDREHDGFSNPNGSQIWNDIEGKNSSSVTFNSACPVCGMPVYFFRSADGGRVYFDELGKPWPKHPCMDAVQPSFQKRSSKDDAGELEPLTSGAVPVILLFRSRGMYFGVETDNEIEWFTGKLDLAMRYLPGAWVTRSKQNTVKALQFLTEDIEPIEIAVRPSKEPAALSDRTIVGSIQNHKKEFHKFLKRLKLPSTPNLAKFPDGRYFGISNIGNSRLLIIPLVADQSENDAYEIERASDSFLYSLIEKAMSASKAKGFQSDFLYADQVLIVGTDPFSQFENSKPSLPQRRLKQVEQNSTYEFSDELEYQLENEHFMESLGCPIVSWCNVIDDGLLFDEVLKTVGDALSTERAFCNATWPNEVTRNDLLAYFEERGIGQLFNWMRSELLNRGWELDQRPSYQRDERGDYACIFLRSSGNQKTPHERFITVLCHASSAENGIALIVQEANAETTLKDTLQFISGPKKYQELLRRFGHQDLV